MEQARHYPQACSDTCEAKHAVDRSDPSVRQGPREHTNAERFQGRSEKQRPEGCFGPFVAQKHCEIGTHPEARCVIQQLGARFARIIFLDDGEPDTDKIENRKHRHARREIQVGEQAHVFIVENAQRDHWLLGREGAREGFSGHHEVLVNEERDENDGADDKRNEDGR